MQAEGQQGSDLLNEHKNWLIDNLENDEENFRFLIDSKKWLLPKGYFI